MAANPTHLSLLHTEVIRRCSRLTDAETPRVPRPRFLGRVLLLKLRFSLFDSRYASVVGPALNLNFSLLDADPCEPAGPEFKVKFLLVRRRLS